MEANGFIYFIRQISLGVDTENMEIFQAESLTVEGTRSSPQGRNTGAVLSLCKTSLWAGPPPPFPAYSNILGTGMQFTDANFKVAEL